MRGEKGVYRARVGKHRVLYSIFDEERLVLVLKVDKRERERERELTDEFCWMRLKDRTPIKVVLW